MKRRQRMPVLFSTGSRKHNFNQQWQRTFPWLIFKDFFESTASYCRWKTQICKSQMHRLCRDVYIVEKTKTPEQAAVRSIRCSLTSGQLNVKCNIASNYLHWINYYSSEAENRTLSSCQRRQWDLKHRMKKCSRAAIGEQNGTKPSGLTTDNNPNPLTFQTQTVFIIKRSGCQHFF